MGLTYTGAGDRQRRQGRTAAFSFGEGLLVATSGVILLAVCLAFTGRMRADAWNRAHDAAPLNLNASFDADALERTLSAVLDAPGDRRLAAHAMLAAFRGDAGPRVLPNVGALARLTISTDAIARDRTAVTFRERAAGADTVIPLLTPAQLTALKPSLSVRTPAEFRSTVLWCTVVLLLSVHLVSLVWRWRGIPGDRLLLAIVQLLVGVGFVVLMTRPDPLRDTLLLPRYTEGIAIGAALCALVSVIDVDRAGLRGVSYVPLLGALGLSVLLIAFGSGPGASTAKVNLGPVQPIEAIRLLLGLFLAGYFARRWELLRQVRVDKVRGRTLPTWIHVPRLAHVLPVVMGVGAALVLFFFQKDLGPALLLALMFLALFAVARGGAGLAAAGLAALGLGVGFGQWLHVSSTLSARLAMWQSPWDNAVRGGDQVAHALWGMASGASAGTGLGLGQTRLIPEGHTDLVLAAVGEELGLAGLLVVFVAFALLAWRGATIARRAANDYGFFLALALTLSLVVPVLVMTAGMLGALPLTGIVTPFLSYGGSAMVANFVSVGLLVAIGRGRQNGADLAPFEMPVRWLGRVGLACGVLLAGIAVSVQAVDADAYLVRPQLGLQADGGRRFQYNPRVLDVLRQIPRGTIFDREGLPLATGDRTLMRNAAGAYARAGVKIAETCTRGVERCYPLGPVAFHLLGDANSRVNWAAANTSYLERDAEDVLRGFDDRARAVTTADRDGRSTLAVRRDYTAAVPLVRHRYEPSHASVQALLTKPRDLRTSLDAPFQAAVASILARAARTSGSGRGAVAVLDAATGQVLASVSVPWPTADADDESSDEEGAALLDRARYGLYPPGSTFKMITAAAALRSGPALSTRAFMCERLPSGRVGIKIPGFGPPVHDDAHDTQPHGEVTMEHGLVRSCNAYFAQLAVALGPDVLSRTAAAAGIALNTSQAPARVRANLPHAGYGQGEVLVSPLRLARVAAAIGTDGVIREMPIGLGHGASSTTSFLEPEAAQTLAGFLREAVLTGTGRVLRDHPARIAGKTGTAEVDDAGPHAWFAGFAPHGPATRRIAFAVIFEHAGYGGAAAARAAGEIATAAMNAGFVR